MNSNLPQHPVLTIKHNTGSYNVHIGDHLLDNIQLLTETIPENARICIVSDRTVAKHYLDPIQKILAKHRWIVKRPFLFAPGERSKSMNTTVRLLNHLCSLGMSRNDFIFALGGGVTGDLAGFAAATFMRGIPFIQLPTSLLAQVDASIGGKTGVNLPAGKNLAGAFHFPRAVVIDTATLKTLPRRQWNNGLAEIIKMAMIADAALLDHLETTFPAEKSRLNAACINPVVLRTCQLKARIVEQDERENGIRAWLNLGHTLGHSLEKGAGYGVLLHGEAVGLGMIAACYIGEKLGVTEQGLTRRLRRILHKFGLPLTSSGINPDQVLSDLKLDKKNRSGRLRMILPVTPGTVIIHENPPAGLLQEAVDIITQ